MCCGIVALSSILVAVFASRLHGGVWVITYSEYAVMDRISYQRQSLPARWEELSNLHLPSAAVNALITLCR